MSLKIAQLLPWESWGSVEPTLLQRGCGGREAALLELASNWAQLGHVVDSYVHCDAPVEISHPSGGTERYVSADLAADCLRSFSYDAIVSVEAPVVFVDDEIMRMQRGAKRYVHMQCAHVSEEALAAPPDAFTYAVLSRWHERFTKMQDPGHPAEVHPNGIRLSRFAKRPADRVPGPPRFVYSSSPDRGLAHMLRAWPLIRSEYPYATLKVLYAAEHWLAVATQAHHRDSVAALDVRELFSLPGVEYVGRVSQRRVATELSMADALLYPCDTVQPTETGCITIVEACAAGALPVITDCDCLGEEFAGVSAMSPLPYDNDSYVGSLLELLEDRELQIELREKMWEFAQSRDWTQLARGWTECFASTETHS